MCVCVCTCLVCVRMCFCILRGKHADTHKACLLVWEVRRKEERKREKRSDTELREEDRVNLRVRLTENEGQKKESRRGNTGQYLLRLYQMSFLSYSQFGLNFLNQSLTVIYYHVIFL